MPFAPMLGIPGLGYDPGMSGGQIGAGQFLPLTVMGSTSTQSPANGIIGSVLGNLAEGAKLMYNPGGAIQDGVSAATNAASGAASNAIANAVSPSVDAAIDTAKSMGIYAAMTLVILVGLVALVMSTDQGQEAVRTASEAAVA